MDGLMACFWKKEMMIFLRGDLDSRFHLESAFEFRFFAHRICGAAGVAAEPAVRKSRNSPPVGRLTPPAA
jgi:hypothetical protein